MSLFGCTNTGVKPLKTEGLTPQAAEKKYGTPDTKNEFILKEQEPEIRMGLYRTLSPKDRVLEYIWEQKNYTVVIWFHPDNGQWTAVEGIRYGKDVRF